MFAAPWLLFLQRAVNWRPDSAVVFWRNPFATSNPPADFFSARRERACTYYLLANWLSVKGGQLSDDFVTPELVSSVYVYLFPVAALLRPLPQVPAAASVCFLSLSICYLLFLRILSQVAGQQEAFASTFRRALPDYPGVESPEEVMKKKVEAEGVYFHVTVI